MGYKEVEEAVLEMSTEEKLRLRALLNRLTDPDYDDDWDRQMATDAKAGRLDDLLEAAKRAHAEGRTRPLPGTREA